MLPRWQRHWWEWKEVQAPDPEPNVWVDLNLYVERPHARLARGTAPPPSCEGAYCALDQPPDTERVLVLDVSELEGISETEGIPLVVDD